MAEIMIVVAIIALLASVAIPFYSSSLHHAKITKCVSELKAVTVDIEIFRNQNGTYPVSIDDLPIRGYFDPWGTPYQYLNIKIQDGMRLVRKDMNLIPLNTYYDLYSMGPDKETWPPISHVKGRDDIMVANDGDYVGIAGDYH